MRGIIIHLICGVAFFFILVSNVQPVQAAGTQDTTGTCEYDKAYDVLDIVNKERKSAGLDKLVMDKELLETAMMRAAEITVLFSHDRPNGESCFSASDKMYGENVAYGYTSPSHVMSGWMNSPGHKRNILLSDYQSIGIGVFYKNGVRYWVQCFGYTKADKVSQPSNIKRTYKVSLTKGKETTLADSNPLATKVEKFKATAGKRKLTLKWRKKSDVDGYQLQVSSSKSYKNTDTYTIGKGKVSKTITKYQGKKMKSKKRYYVRIRAYQKVTNADGITSKNYSKWEKLNVKTK